MLRMFLIVLIVVFLVGCSNQKFQIKKVEFPNEKLKMILETQKTNTNSLCFDDYHGFLNIDNSKTIVSKCPLEIISKLEATDGDRNLAFPESSYADLISLHEDTFKLISNSKNSEVIIFARGSDAGCSYGVKFYFSNNQLTRRVVWSGEFPDQYYETIYYNVNIQQDKIVKKLYEKKIFAELDDLKAEATLVSGLSTIGKLTSMISSLKVNKSKNSLYLNSSAYIDLSNVDDIKITRFNKDKYNLKVYGKFGEERYEAIFRFDTEILTSRELWLYPDSSLDLSNDEVSKILAQSNFYVSEFDEDM